MPKKGKSSPVIWGDKIFITGAQDMMCEVYCINKKTGEILWTGSASDIPGEPAVLPKMDQEAGLAVSTVLQMVKWYVQYLQMAIWYASIWMAKRNGQKTLVFLKAVMDIPLHF